MVLLKFPPSFDLFRCVLIVFFLFPYHLLFFRSFERMCFHKFFLSLYSISPLLNYLQIIPPYCITLRNNYFGYADCVNKSKSSVLCIERYGTTKIFITTKIGQKSIKNRSNHVAFQDACNMLICSVYFVTFSPLYHTFGH